MSVDKVLTKRNLNIWKRRDSGETLQAVADDHRISRERVRQVFELVEARLSGVHRPARRWSPRVLKRRVLKSSYLFLLETRIKQKLKQLRESKST